MLSKEREPMSIRGRLMLLALAVLVPSVVASLVAMTYVYRERERSVEGSLLEMSRALALVVDRKIESRKSFLMMLAASPALERNRLDLFAEELSVAAVLSGAAVFLYGPDGLPVLGSAAFEDAFIPPEALERARPGPRENLVSDVYTAPGGVKSYAISRQVTIRGDGGYRLAMIAPINLFQDVFDALDLPTGWTGTILDRRGILVGRNRDPHLHVGEAAFGNVMEHLAGGDYAVFVANNREGVSSLHAFSKDPIGWSSLVAIPEADINQSAVDALRMLAVFAVLLLIGAVFLAVQVGRSIVAPMRILTKQAEALGRNLPLATRTTGLRETDVVSASMRRAGNQLRDARLTMEERVAEAVAESQRSQAALLQSQKLEALGRLTGGIAHDFNNLLQTLSTGLHLADVLSPDPNAKQALDACKRAVGRAGKLARQLMAFGRSEVSEARRIDLRDQLLGMKDLLKGALRSITLRLELAHDLWPVHADPLQFELALLNLAINARDATEATGSVLVSAKNITVGEGDDPELAAGDYVKLCFCDDGSGMSREVLEKALDPFFTTKPTGMGSGLGLAQVYGFIKQSKGTVTLDSEVGHGTAITMFLPRSSDDVVPADGSGDLPAPDPGVAGSGATVLVVEDDVLVRDVLGPALESHGFHVLSAGNADEALQLLAQHRVDIVFSDIVMPGSMNGAKLAELVRRDHPRVPVVLASGYSEHAGVPADIRILAKPYELSAVVATLRQALAAV
jgi:signal transduction histidine kinase